MMGEKKDLSHVDLVTRCADIIHDECCLELYCRDCGAQVRAYQARAEAPCLTEIIPESVKYDYWYSCNNLTCKNHYGEGLCSGDTISGEWPEWIEDRGLQIVAIDFS